MTDYESDYYPEIAGWFRARGAKAPKPENLPKVGVFIQEVAVGFLIQTDTSTAILDFFIANPEATKAARSTALDMIAKELIGKAKMLGFDSVRCDSQLDTIVKRARALGFSDLGDFKVFTKEI